MEATPMNGGTLRTLAVWTNVVAAFGCSADQGAGPTSSPSVSHTAATANPLNALSTAVTFQAANADSARIVFWGDGDSPQATPYYTVSDTSARIVVLGLHPTTFYNYVVEVIKKGVSARSA